MSISAAKIFNRYRNAERLAGNGTPNIYAERGEGEIEAIRSRQKWGRDPKRQISQSYCLKEGVLVIALDKFNYSL